MVTVFDKRSLIHVLVKPDVVIVAYFTVAAFISAERNSCRPSLVSPWQETQVNFTASKCNVHCFNYNQSFRYFG